MSSSKPKKWPRLEPNLQVSFYYRLGTLRELYLDEALSATIAKLEVTLNDRLARGVDGVVHALHHAAQHSARCDMVLIGIHADGIATVDDALDTAEDPPLNMLTANHMFVCIIGHQLRYPSPGEMYVIKERKPAQERGILVIAGSDMASCQH